jgi:hypothetical protein
VPSRSAIGVVAVLDVQPSQRRCKSCEFMMANVISL